MRIVIKSIAIAIILFFGGLLFLLTTHVGGWRGFIVMSASMEPTIPTGALVIAHQVPPHTLKETDVITFVRPDKPQEIVTHRIENIHQEKTLSVIKTKGDKNTQPDVWTLAGGGVIGKVQLSIPYLGYLLTFTKTKLGILFFILVPAVYIIIEELKVMMNLFKKKTPTLESKEATLLVISVLIGISSFSFHPTYALLSDTALLQHSTFAIICTDKPK